VDEHHENAFTAPTPKNRAGRQWLHVQVLPAYLGNGSA
jgi:hypothetical protein